MPASQASAKAKTTSTKKPIFHQSAGKIMEVPD